MEFTQLLTRKDIIILFLMIVNVHNQEFSCPAEFGGLRNALIPLYRIRRKIVVNISDDITNKIEKLIRWLMVAGQFLPFLIQFGTRSVSSCKWIHTQWNLYGISWILKHKFYRRQIGMINTPASSCELNCYNYCILVIFYDTRRNYMSLGIKPTHLQC